MRSLFIFLAVHMVGILILTGCQSEQLSPTLRSSPEGLPTQVSSSTPSPVVTLSPTVSTPDETTPEAAVTDTEQSPILEISSVPEETPTSLPSPTPSFTNTPQVVDCLDEAAFYSDVTIPDDTLFEVGESMTKVWQVRNTGTCTWDDNYSLVFAKGDLMDGPLSNPIPVVPPGEIAEVSVNLVAPSRGGQQTGYWEFQNSIGTRFGVGSGGHDYIWVQIVVNWSSPTEEPTTVPGDDDEPSPTAGPTEKPSGGNDDECGAARNKNYENQVLDLINSAREAAGLPALSLNGKLSAAAFKHSKDMACADYVDHTGSDGSTWYDRVAEQGYANYNAARENIYVGDPTFGGTPEGAFNWWMNSQVHRDNILYTSASEIGIGYVYYSDSTYGGYYTVVFARP